MIGFININKPSGITSFDVVRRIKRILNFSHVGHLGTLDPLASGVLPIAVGKATRLFDYFLTKDKEYIGDFLIGTETDSQDITGKIIGSSSNRFSITELQKVVSEFVGEIDQIPPKYSAKKINGERAYKLAKQEKDFEMLSKKVKIYAILPQLDSRDNLLRLNVHCRAGTYIRTLGCDICKRLGTVCAMKSLQRTRSGCFKIEDSVTLEEFENLPKITPVEEVLCNLNRVFLTGENFKKLKNGVKIFLDDDIEGEFFIFGEDKLFCLAELNEDNSVHVLANLYEGEN